MIDQRALDIAVGQFPMMLGDVARSLLELGGFPTALDERLVISIIAKYHRVVRELAR